MSFNESREMESENAFQVGNALLQRWRGGRRGGAVERLVQGRAAQRPGARRESDVSSAGT